jgi:hypothetical protein
MCEVMKEQNLDHELCYTASEVENIKKFCGECEEKSLPGEKFRKCNVNPCNQKT